MLKTVTVFIVCSFTFLGGGFFGSAVGASLARANDAVKHETKEPSFSCKQGDENNLPMIKETVQEWADQSHEYLAAYDKAVAKSREYQPKMEALRREDGAIQAEVAADQASVKAGSMSVEVFKSKWVDGSKLQRAQQLAALQAQYQNELQSIYRQGQPNRLKGLYVEVQKKKLVDALVRGDCTEAVEIIDSYQLGTQITNEQLMEMKNQKN